MDNSTNDMSEKLLQYLDGELTVTERDDIERKLATDDSLRNEWENLKLARGIIQNYGLSQKVATIHNQMVEELRTPVRSIGRTRRFIRYSIAIAASILIVFLANMIYSSNSLSPAELFDRNYFTYELTTSRETGTGETAIEKAYRAKEYTLVTKLADTATNIKAAFLAASAYMELKDDNKAIEKYKTVIAANDSEGTNMLKDESEYYMSLAYLRNKNYNHALELMQKIHNDSSHLYHNKITGKLIRDVKKLI